MLQETINGTPEALRCTECGVAAENDAANWKAYIGGGFEGVPLEVAAFCPTCAAKEFGD